MASPHLISRMASLPLALISQAIPRLSRHDLEVLTERLIDHLDQIDGDPDEEYEDPEVETVLMTYKAELPPPEDDGDPDLEDVDEREHDADMAGDPAWAEWHTLTAAQQRSGDMLVCGSEDDEDDDPDTGVEDDPLGIDPEEDSGDDDVGELDEAGNGLTPDWGIDQTQPLPDAMVLASDRHNKRRHISRIRKTRCIPEWRRNYHTGRMEPSRSEFDLIKEPRVPTRRQLLKRKRGMPRRPRG